MRNTVRLHLTEDTTLVTQYKDSKNAIALFSKSLVHKTQYEGFPLIVIMTEVYDQFNEFKSLTVRFDFDTNCPFSEISKAPRHVLERYFDKFKPFYQHFSTPIMREFVQRNMDKSGESNIVLSESQLCLSSVTHMGIHTREWFDKLVKYDDLKCDFIHRIKFFFTDNPNNLIANAIYCNGISVSDFRINGGESVVDLGSKFTFNVHLNKIRITSIDDKVYEKDKSPIPLGGDYHSATLLIPASYSLSGVSTKGIEYTKQNKAEERVVDVFIQNQVVASPKSARAQATGKEEFNTYKIAMRLLRSNALIMSARHKDSKVKVERIKTFGTNMDLFRISKI